jgi:hypothetical protein
MRLQLTVRPTNFIKRAASVSGHCSDGNEHCENGHAVAGARNRVLAKDPALTAKVFKCAAAT